MDKKNDGYWVVYEANGVRWSRRYDGHKDFKEKKDKEGGTVVDLGLTRETAQSLCLEHPVEKSIDYCVETGHQDIPSSPSDHGIHPSFSDDF